MESHDDFSYFLIHRAQFSQSSTEEIKENTKSKHKEMPEPPCCRIVKLKETESTCSSIDLTVILDPRSSNTESLLNDLNSTCQEQNMQEVAKKRSETTERKFAQRNGESTDLEKEKRIEEGKS
jgi:hypothetical protein